MTPEQSTSMNRRMGAMEQQLKALAEMVQHINDNMATKADLAAVKVDVSAVKADVTETKEIVQIWSSAKTVGRVIKWMAGIVSSIAVLLLVTKTLFTGLMK